MRVLILICLFVLATPLAFAADARQLKEEAIAILKANTNKQATPEQYAESIFKLEAAQAMLDKANDNDSPLAQEVSSSLFWARKFSDVVVMAALDKLKGGSGAPITKKPDPPKAPPAAKTPDPDADDEAPKAVLAEAKKAYGSAEAFAKSHSSDDYAIAMAWFKMANDHTGTDYALKALEFARAAQTRFAAKTAPKEELPDTPEMKLVLEADALVAAGKIKEAFALYLSSLKLKETQIAHRKLGHAYFKRAQEIKDEFLPKLETLEAEYKTAVLAATTVVRSVRGGQRRVINRNHPAMLEVARKNNELIKEGKVAVDYYNLAESEFKAVLKLAPSHKDLDAAGHMVLCLTVRGDASIRIRARQQLVQFLSDYKPANDLERSLYEFCKSELERLIKGK